MPRILGTRFAEHDPTEDHSGDGTHWTKQHPTRIHDSVSRRRTDVATVPTDRGGEHGSDQYGTTIESMRVRVTKAYYLRCSRVYKLKNKKFLIYGSNIISTYS